MGHDEQFVDQILTSLKIIGRIKEGQKVCVRDGLLSIENKSTGVMSSFRRWVNGDNRFTTLSYIKNVVSNAIEIASLCKEDDIKSALGEAIVGLGSLAVTYGHDAAVLATIEVMQDRIKKNISTKVNERDRNRKDKASDARGRPE